MTATRTGLPRLEDPRLLKGQGCFVDDVHLPGAVEMAVLRSPYAHARIVSVDTAAAAKLPGVVAVVTARDLGEIGNRSFPPVFTHSSVIREKNTCMLANDRVRYVGEPVAAVVARDRYIAEDALDLIQVEYEPLGVVHDIEQAVAPGAPLVYEDLPNNVSGRMHQLVGDPDRAFAEADRVLRERLHIDRGSAQPMETRGVVACLEPATGNLLVWVGAQAPHRHRRVISQVLGMPEEKVRVIIPDVGGAFGMKGNVYPEDVLVPALALRLGRPVKWIEDRRESFLGSTHERSQVHEVEVAVKHDGTVLAIRDRALHDCGAYNPYGMVQPQNTQNHTCSTYRIPHLDLEIRSVFTNKMTSAAYRGAGRPQGVFIGERVMDLVARELGIDPVAVRRKNLITKEEHPYNTGLAASGRGKIIYDTGNYPECLDKALAALDYEGWRERQRQARLEGRHIGIGVVNYVEASATLPYEGATVRIDHNGRVAVLSGAAAQGQGHQTMFARVVGDVLGIPPEDVLVVTGDTGAIPYGIGTFGSRTTALAGSAAHVAAHAVKEKALRLAAVMTSQPLASVSWQGTHVMAGERELTLGALAAAAANGLLPDEPPGLEATHYQKTPQSTFSSGSHACVLEIDLASGLLHFHRYVVVHDCGVMINPLTVDGQVIGGVAQGLGGALYENLCYDEAAQLLTATYMDYLLPTATEVPSVTIEHVETPTPLNPLGAKGAGEGGTVPVYALVAQAVEDALAPFGNPRVTRLPLTPDAILRLAGQVHD